MPQFVRFNDTTTQDIVFTFNETLAVAGGVNPTGGFGMATAAGAMLLVSATNDAASKVITFRTRVTENAASSFVVASSSNAPVTLTVQPGRAYPLPDELFACPYVLATTAASGQTVTCRIVTKT